MTDIADSIKPKKKLELLKVFAVIAIAAIILCITTLTQGKIEKARQPANWTSYEFQIKNKTMTLPCSYEELKANTGYSMQKEIANTLMTSETTYRGANLFSLQDNPSLFIMLIPTKPEPQPYDECMINYINQSYQMVKDGAEPVIFPGEITVGTKTSLNKLMKVFGYPNELRYYPDETFVLIWKENAYEKDSGYYEIVLEKEMIEEIILKSSNSNLTF